MADIFRTKAELLTLFADNTSGDISEQDLRDFVMSALGGLGSIVVTGGTTTQTVSATPVAVANWSADGINSDVITDYTTGEITIGTTGAYAVFCDLCFEGDGNDTYYFVPYIDTGSGFVDSGAQRLVCTIDAGGHIAHAGMHGQLALNAGDVIKLYVWSTTGGTSLLLREGILSFKREF